MDVLRLTRIGVCALARNYQMDTSPDYRKWERAGSHGISGAFLRADGVHLSAGQTAIHSQADRILFGAGAAIAGELLRMLTGKTPLILPDEYGMNADGIWRYIRFKRTALGYARAHGDTPEAMPQAIVGDLENFSAPRVVVFTDEMQGSAYYFVVDEERRDGRETSRIIEEGVLTDAKAQECNERAGKAYARELQKDQLFGHLAQRKYEEVVLDRWIRDRAAVMDADELKKWQLALIGSCVPSNAEVEEALK